MLVFLFHHFIQIYHINRISFFHKKNLIDEFKNKNENFKQLNLNIKIQYKYCNQNTTFKGIPSSNPFTLFRFLLLPLSLVLSLLYILLPPQSLIIYVFPSLSINDYAQIYLIFFSSSPDALLRKSLIIISQILTNSKPSYHYKSKEKYKSVPGIDELLYTRGERVRLALILLSVSERQIFIEN